jgi:hypothetical protein
MKIFQRQRGGGKTKMIMEELLADPNAMCIVADSRRAHYMNQELFVRLYNRPGPLPRQVYSIEEASRMGLKLNLYHGIRVFVDDVDNVLEWVLQHCIEAATFTGEVDTRHSPERVPGAFFHVFEGAR